MKKRIPVIAGNWKMNMTVQQGVELVNGIFYGLRFVKDVDVIVAPPFTSLYKISEVLRDTYISVAAQNLHWEDKGAFTGEISPSFIKDVGASSVIIGHSERRQYFGETDETVNKKIKAALQHGLTPIFCVGETLSERESNQYHQVLSTQIQGGLAGLSAVEVEQLIIAYEPVWAIGTGVTASTQQAEEAHLIIRNLLAQNFGAYIADEVRILYGGSVNAKNAKELLSSENIDGALVGGASLKADDFIQIIKSAT